MTDTLLIVFGGFTAAVSLACPELTVIPVLLALGVG
jgi:hypothetical protein